MIRGKFADRGSNNYYTVFPMNLLKKKCLVFESILPNQGSELIQSYEKQHFISENIGYSKARSLDALSSLLANNLVRRTKIKNMIDKTDHTILKILSYSMSKDRKKMHLYTHALSDLLAIQKLAHTMGVGYSVSRAIKLPHTIESINAMFQKNYLQKNGVHGLLDKLELFIWNRHHPQRPTHKINYLLYFLHGQDEGKSSHQNVVNLDYNKGLGKRSQSAGELQAFIIFQ
jgi:hypothetical protein